MPAPSPVQIAFKLASRSRAALERHAADVPLISRSLLDARSASLVHDEALVQGRSRVLIVAPPASGKTVLLRMLTERLLQSWGDTGGATNCPILVRAYELDRHLADPNFVEIGGTQLSLAAALDGLDEYKCTLIIDGLDEAPSPSRAATRIAEFAHFHPALSVIVSCRPGTYREALSEFETFTLGPLAMEDTTSFVTHLFESETALQAEFMRALDGYEGREPLASNPLLLRMAAETFRQTGRLPRTDPVEMMKDLIDKFVGMVPEYHEPTLPTIEDRLAALGELAVSLFAKNQVVQPLSELLLDLSPQGAPQPLDRMIGWLERAALVQIAQDEISFIHKSIQQFFVARHFRNDAAGLASFLDELGDFNTDIIRYAAGLVDELGPLVERLIERGHLILAANCVSWGKSRNTALADHVIDLIERALEPRIFAQLLRRGNAATPGASEPPPTVPDPYDALLGLFDRALEEVPNHERGRRFEEFTGALFDGVFKPVRMNYRTEHGEIDIVMENVGQGNFWAEYGGDVFVECKNLNHGAEAHMVHTFSSKAQLAGLKLAFFVSLNGFSNPALTAIRTKSLMTGQPLLVPLHGSEIREALLRRVDLEGFFKDQIRKVRHQGG